MKYTNSLIVDKEALERFEKILEEQEEKEREEQ